MARASSSLPVPDSPTISTLRVGGGDALDQRQQLAHARRVADRPIADAARLGDLAAQAPHLARHAAVVERALHRGAQLVARGRLAQVVEGALAHRLDRGLDGGVAGEHDERAASERSRSRARA